MNSAVATAIGTPMISAIAEVIERADDERERPEVVLRRDPVVAEDEVEDARTG